MNLSLPARAFLEALARLQNANRNGNVNPRLEREYEAAYDVMMAKSPPTQDSPHG